MLKKIALAVIDLYRLVFSPYRGPSCRFVPTCSAFAKEAIERHGVRQGFLMTLARLARCHPLHAGGFDPVVKRQTKGLSP